MCGGGWFKMAGYENTGPHTESFFELLEFWPPFIHLCGGYFFGLDLDMQPPLQGMGAGA